MGCSCSHQNKVTTSEMAGNVMILVQGLAVVHVQIFANIYIYIIFFRSKPASESNTKVVFESLCKIFKPGTLV